MTRYGASLFIGTTTGGREEAVFWDSHTPIINNNPPGTLITGAPGSGKTFMALTLTAMATIMGKTVAVLDPKGDFLNLANIQNDIGKFVLIDLSKGKPGLLDPFYMAQDPVDKIDLALEVIDIFVGGLTGDELTALSPILKDVVVEPNPSLQKVVDMLRSSERQIARNLGTKIDLLKQLPFARLCFAPGSHKRQSLRVDSGLTVFTLAGLEIAAAGNTDPTNKEKLGAGIMFLLTDFLRRIMENDNSKSPKTIVIDECHILASNKSGANAIKKIALLGRSKYLSLILITQSVSHLTHLEIENTISTRFAFRTDTKEAQNIVKSMELPEEEGFESIITHLEVGECLMEDFNKKYATIKVSSWKKDWKEAFATNPLDYINKKKAEEESRRQTESAS